MEKKYFSLGEAVPQEPSDRLPVSQPFILNYKTALLLSILDKNLLTQQQFDRCVEELQKQSRSK